MERWKKEFFMNVSLYSFLLSALYSLFITSYGGSLVSPHSYISGPDKSVIFTMFFLGLYVFHVLVSSLAYAAARIAGNRLLKRLVTFNAIGILLVGTICYAARNAAWLFLILSFVVFSILSAINSVRQNN
ncbi:hypothetical protein LJK88_02380 [Paenibacillus sp. P26]|nr:hypothetical protein LJK88_02380 [Paenibacillus sp. P26]UUZ90978.1 hypothetical protein LJK87_35110 [Paenibacillus sp. P25]